MSPVTAKSIKLLEELQAIDFVLVELTLYLDTHPEDEEALTQFNETAQTRHELKEKVEAEFGSLTKMEPHNGGKSKGWDAGPWPWQL